MEHVITQRRAFSLNELLICIAIISIGFLGTLAALIGSQKAVKYGERRTEAITYCRQICEIIRAQGRAWPIPPPGDPCQTNPPTRTDIPLNQGSLFAGLPANTRYTKSIRIEAMGTSGERQFLARVTVQVFWQEPNGLKNVTMVTFSRNPLT